MAFEFQPFSRKQRQLLHWWRAGSGVEDRRMVLADGAIRSGKTVAMILSFLMWSLTVFSGRDFILAGVTSGALRRNVLMPMFFKRNLVSIYGYLEDRFGVSPPRSLAPR